VTKKVVRKDFDDKFGKLYKEACKKVIMRRARICEEESKVATFE